MDHREPPGTSPPAAPLTPTPRFPRLVAPPTVRRLAPSSRIKAAAAIVAGAIVVVAAFLAVMIWVEHSVDVQPAYRLSYREIALVPPPPAWLHGGRIACLENALGGAAEFDSFSSLDFDHDRLLLMFRRYPWIEKALRVEVVHPNRVSVALVYREPVAVHRLADRSEGTVVDREGVILPRGDIDFEQAGPLIKLHGFDPPADPRAGEVWSQVDRQGIPARDDRVRGASRLAAFLRSKLIAALPNAPALGFVAIHPWGADGYSVQVGANLMFKWDEPGAVEPRSRLSDEAKWAMLLERVRQTPTKAGDPWVELKFTKDGVAVDSVHDEP